MSRNFLFLSVNSSYSHSSPALALLHCAAVNVPDWTWEHLECTIAEDFAEIAAKAADRKPDLVGASLYIFNRNQLLEILRRLHVLMPEVRIVLGGPECAVSNAHEILTEYPFVHDVFVGETEGIFADYLANYDVDAPRRVLPEKGIAVYDKWAETQFTEDVFFRTDKAFVQYETSRGCPIGCKYCTSSRIPLRMKELPCVEKELCSLHQRGVREVRLLDRTFNFPQWRGAALLKLFREKFPDMEFHLEIHPQFINEELKNELRQAPNLHVEAGVQSLDENVQQAIGRNSCRDDVIAGIKFLTSCANFEMHVDLICGLPEQNSDIILADVLELVKCRADEIQLETLKILPGTALEQEAQKYGLRYSPQVPYDVMQTPHLTYSEILYMRKVSRVLDIFHNHSALREVFRALELQTAADLRKFIDFVTEAGVELKCVLDLKKRLLLLTDFVRKYSLNEAEFEIGKVWVNNNYPLAALPFGNLSKFEEKVPEEIMEKNREIFAHRETKIWSFVCGNHCLNFAVNRHFKLNGAAVVWEKNCRE